MKEPATVTLVKPNGKVVVEVRRSTACENCSSECLVGKTNLNIQAEIDMTRMVSVGDTVFVELEFGSLMTATSIAYGIPLFFLLAGMFLGYYFIAPAISMSPDTTGFISAISFMFLSWGGLRIAQNKGLFDEKYKIRLAEK